MSAAGHRTAAIVLLASTVFAATGCDDPYRTEPAAPGTAAREPAPAVASPLQQRSDPPASGELPGRVPRGLLDEPHAFPEAGHTPAETLRLAARLYGNWNSANAAHQLERLAGLCVGQARAELDLAAAQAGADPQQRQARSRASVEAVEVDGTSARREALVVTRQRIQAADLPAQGWRYQVTTAQIERRGPKWVISKWLAQP
jgi:hypothetical protein